METVKVFRSYVDAAKRLEKAVSEAEAYRYIMAILDYGLDGIEPDPDTIAGSMFAIVKPNIDASIKKATGNAKGGSQTQVNASRMQVNGSQPQVDSKSTEVECKSTLTEEGSRKKKVGSRRKDKGERITEVGGEENTPQKPPGGGVTERFDRFWQAYPRKIGKQAALKTWSKLKPSAELTEVILAAVEYQKTWNAWTKDGGQYIPNPSTWLNQGRWEDEKPEVAASSTPESSAFDYDPAELEGIF